MNDTRRIKMLAVVAALVVLGTLVLRFAGSSSRPVTSDPSATAVTQSPAAHSTATAGQMPRPMPEEPVEAETDGEFQPRIPREKVEEFLQLRNRSAPSLLAGFHALKDTNLLYEAAAKFPNNPQVQWTMLAQQLNSEERRKWLDRFKQSSPDNSLANYLSAAEHFKSGKSEDAIKELLKASGKKQFKDYAMAAMLDEHELSRFASLTPMDAIGWESSVSKSRPLLKMVANGIVEARTQYLQTGDAQSANTLLQAGLDLAGRVTEGESGRFLSSHMLGRTIEAIMLRQLEPDTHYDFLGGKTPTERLAELKQQARDDQALVASVRSSYGTLAEADCQSYYDRMKTYGDVEAMKWLQQLATNRTAPGK